MFDLGIKVEISCNLDYVQRIEKIRACDVVLFFVSRRTFKAKKSRNTSEMYEDYDCCVNHGKTIHCIALNNIHTIWPFSMSSEAYAFWSKIRKIHGINLDSSLDDYNKAFQILHSVENGGTEREIKSYKVVYIAAGLVVTALMGIFAVLKDSSFVSKPTVPLGELTTVDSISIGRHVQLVRAGRKHINYVEIDGVQYKFDSKENMSDSYVIYYKDGT